MKYSKAFRVRTVEAVRFSLIWGLAGSFLLLPLAGMAWAKEARLQGIHYQPEGMVIQLAGGSLKAPEIETWPNQRDGVKTEQIIVRLPGYTGELEALQKEALAEISGHPEVKQLWITPFGTDPKALQGTQVLLEVETRPDLPEFTPQVLSQGEEQWVITLESVATQPRRLPPSKRNDQLARNDDVKSAPTHPNAVAESEPSNGRETASLLTELNQSRQKQAALGAQLAAAQQALKDSQAREEALQDRLNGYENILQDAGVDPSAEERLESAAVIQNLRSALMRVAQKLKTAEAALADRQNSPSVGASALASTPKAASDAAVKDRLPAPVQSVAVPPIATLGMVGPAVAGQSSGMSPLKLSPVPGKPGAVEPVPVAKKVTRVYMATGLDSDQENHLIQSLQAEPHSGNRYLKLADFYVAKGQWSKAKSTLLMLSRMQPENVQGFYYLTLLYLHEQNQKAAAFALTQYAQKNPRDTQGIALLRQALKSSGNLPPMPRFKSATGQAGSPPMPLH